MNRFQIKEMRDVIESNGFFVEHIYDDYMIISRLSDPETYYTIYQDGHCPDCNSYIIYEDGIESNACCLNKNCDYEYYSFDDYEVTYALDDLLEEQKNKRLELKLTFNKEDADKNAYEHFLEDLQKLYNYYYDESFDMTIHEFNE